MSGDRWCLLNDYKCPCDSDTCSEDRAEKAEAYYEAASRTCDRLRGALEITECKVREQSRELSALRWWVSLPSSSVGRLSPQLWRAATGIQTVPGGEWEQIDADGPTQVAAVLALYAKCVPKGGA